MYVKVKSIQNKLMDIIAEVEGDERHHYPPADVRINAPLALIQVDLAARKRTALEVMKVINGEERP